MTTHIKPTRNPYGYRELLAYQKADALQAACVALTSHFPSLKTLYSLADQMNRSARSTKQNIVEGWRRNSTEEYYQFLGYSIGSNAELEEDFTDICKGHYPELKGVRGVMGEAEKEKGVKGEMGTNEIESIPFYPLDPLLPLVVQCKLRAKELNFLLEQLQKSLKEKMLADRTLPVSERMRIIDQADDEGDRWLAEQRKKAQDNKNHD